MGVNRSFIGLPAFGQMAGRCGASGSPLEYDFENRRLLPQPECGAAGLVFALLRPSRPFWTTAPSADLTLFDIALDSPAVWKE